MTYRVVKTILSRFGLKSLIQRRRIFYVAAYRHPNADIIRFMHYFQETLLKIEKENKLTCVMGDYFNIHLIDYSNHVPRNDFINTIHPHFLSIFSSDT